MDDLISRQAAIKAVHDEFDECIVWDESGATTANEVERILGEVPSAQKRGKWVLEEAYGLYRCSMCGVYAVDGMNFCVNCGADMRGD